VRQLCLDDNEPGFGCIGIESGDCAYSHIWGLSQVRGGLCRCGLMCRSFPFLPALITWGEKRRMTKAKAKDMWGSVEFFHEQAGYSYDPKTETPEQGRRRCALALAEAELWFWNRGGQVEWEEDDCPDRSGIDHGGPLFVCTVRVRCSECGEWRTESLGGIDLGPTGNECDDYKRVVVAEMALELKR
jgi:hypothetical protein